MPPLNLPTGTTERSLEIGARIDRIPRLTKTHTRLLVLIAALFVFDIMDLTAFALVSAAIRAELQLSIQAVGFLTSTVFIGMMIGGMFGGRLADRFGRKPVAIGAVLAFSLGSLASAIAPNFELLAASRVVTGIGIAATTGVLLVLINELYPKALRGRVTAIALTIGSLGAPLIGVVGLSVVPLGHWRIVFVVGGVGVIAALIAVKALPESPRWLAATGKQSIAVEQVERFEREFTASNPGLTLSAPALSQPASPAKGSVLTIFRLRFLRSTVVASALFFFLLSLQSGLGQWLPTILIEKGYPPEGALGITLVLTFTGIGGGALATIFIDKIERKTVLLICSSVCAVSYAAMGFVDFVPVLIGAGAVGGLTLSVMTAVVFTYAPEIFPIEIRALGTGFANGFARIAGIANSLLIGFVLAAFQTRGVFVYLIVLVLLLGLAAAFGPRVGVVAARRLREKELQSAYVD